MPSQADESTPLVTEQSNKRGKQLRTYLLAPVTLRHADLPLLACCFVTGIIDAGAYNAWGTFMGMQTAAVTRPFGNTRRLSLCINFFLQGLSILVAAMLVTIDAIPQNNADNDRVLIGIPFLAWQFGAQVAASRALGYGEIPTTVLTSVYNDLASDPRLWTWQNAKRNRRAGAAIMVLVGGICGGWLSRLHNGFGMALWIGGLIKMLLGIAWLGYGEAIE
ncbi:MAG: hypothetical protein Q9208_002903 [Pyrenodesmia sp. 3 TL-2023]